ncbi:MAG TPA: SLC13 family permease [Streptosporangiaceae bacterium]|jgi:di/tricarboxylate transporter
MSIELVSIVVLVLIFLVATLRSINMGALAIVAAFIFGVGAVGEKADDIFAGFPGDLFVILVGVTFLFAIAKANGTVDWLVHASVRMVGGRIVAIPWVMFFVTALLTAVGAVVPGAVAIIVPIGMGFARRYKINPVLMGLMVINGATAGGFSPISIFGGITNGVVSRNHLDGSPITLFLASFVANLLLTVVSFFLFGGRKLLRDRRTVAESEPVTVTAGGGEGRTGGVGGALAPPSPAEEPAEDAPVTTLDLHRALTVLGVVVLAVGSLFFDLDVGVTALGVALVLSLISPSTTKNAVNGVAWSTVLLVCGIVTYISLLEKMGTVDWLGNGVARIGVPLLAALVICFIGGGVSAFASTTGILGALIPLAVPFLQHSAVGAVGVVTALALSSSIVDSSPFSTSGALTVAAAPEDQRDMVFRRLMAWGFSMIVIAPVCTWLALVVVPEVL